jgi:hypothetical protein
MALLVIAFLVSAFFTFLQQRMGVLQEEFCSTGMGTWHPRHGPRG